MGRYYNGQISGKFWVGVQSSNDATYFGVSHTDIVQYHVCGCELDRQYIEHIIDGKDTSIHVNGDGLFCKDCFESYDEHKQAIIDDDNDFDTNTWFLADNEIYYQFEITDIDGVKSQIQILEGLIGQHMESYSIKDDEHDEITYDYTCPANLSRHELMQVARLCLGKQILYCLEKHGQCYFSAEV